MERFRSRLRFRTREKLRGRLLGRDTSPIPDPALVGLYQQDPSQISGQRLVGFYRDASPIPSPPLVGHYPEGSPVPDESLYGIFRDVSPMRDAMQVGAYPEHLALRDPTMYGFYHPNTLVQDPRYYGFYPEHSPLRDQLYQPQNTEGSLYNFLQETAPASESLFSRFHHGDLAELTGPYTPGETLHLQDPSSEKLQSASSVPKTSLDRDLPLTSKSTPEKQQNAQTTQPVTARAHGTSVDPESSSIPRKAPHVRVSMSDDLHQVSSVPRATVDILSPHVKKGTSEDKQKPQPTEAFSTGVELARPFTPRQTPQFRDPGSETLHQVPSMSILKAEKPDQKTTSPANISTPKDGQKTQPPGVDLRKPSIPHQAPQFQGPMSENLRQASLMPTPHKASQFHDPRSETLQKASSVPRTNLNTSSPFARKNTPEDGQGPQLIQAPRTAENIHAKPKSLSQGEVAHPIHGTQVHKMGPPVPIGAKHTTTLPPDRDTEPSDRANAELPRDASQLGTQPSTQEAPYAVIMQANKPQRMPSPLKQLANKLQDLKQATFTRRPTSLSELSDALAATQRGDGQTTPHDPAVAKAEALPASRELPDVTDVREEDADKYKPKSGKDRSSPNLSNRASPRLSPNLGIRRNNGKMSPMLSKRFSPRLERGASQSSSKLLDDVENPKSKNYLRAMVMIHVRRRTGNESSGEKLKRLLDGTLDHLQYSQDTSAIGNASTEPLPLPSPAKVKHEDESRSPVVVPSEQAPPWRPEASTQEQDERARPGSTAAVRRDTPVDATYGLQRGSAWSGSRRQEPLSPDKHDATAIPGQSREEPWPEKTSFLQSAGDAQAPSRSMDRHETRTKPGDVAAASMRSLERPGSESISYLQPAADAHKPSKSMDRNEPLSRTAEEGKPGGGVRFATSSGLAPVSESHLGQSPHVLSPNKVPLGSDWGHPEGASVDVITDTKAMPREKQQLEPHWKSSKPESKGEIKYEPSGKNDQSDKDKAYAYAAPTRAYEAPAQKHQPVASNEQKTLRERWEDNEGRSLIPQALAEPPQMPYYDARGERDARPAEYKLGGGEAAIHPQRQQQQLQELPQQPHQPQPQESQPQQPQQQVMTQHGSLPAGQTQGGGGVPLEMIYDPRSGASRPDDPRRGGLPPSQGVSEQEPQLRPYSPRFSDKRDRVPDMSLHLQAMQPQISRQKRVESDMSMEHLGKLPSTIIVGPVKYKRGPMYPSDGSDSDSSSKEYYFAKSSTDSSFVGPYRLSEGSHPERPSHRSRDSPLTIHTGSHRDESSMLTTSPLRHPTSTTQSAAPAGASGECASGHGCEGTRAGMDVSTSPILLTRPLPHVPQTTIVNVIIKQPIRSRNKQGRHKDGQEGRRKLRRALGNSASSKSPSPASARHLSEGFGSKTSVSASTQTRSEPSACGTRGTSSDNEDDTDENSGGVCIATQTRSGASRRRKGESLVKSVVLQPRPSDGDEKNREKQKRPQSSGSHPRQRHTKGTPSHGVDGRREDTASREDEEPYLSADDFLTDDSEMECWGQSEAERLMRKEGITVTQGTDERTPQAVQTSAATAPRGGEYLQYSAKEPLKKPHERGMTSKIFESGATETCAHEARGHGEGQSSVREHPERGHRQLDTGTNSEPQLCLPPSLAALAGEKEQEDGADGPFIARKALRDRADAKMEAATAIKEAQRQRPDCSYMQQQSQPGQLGNVAPLMSSVVSEEAAELEKSLKSGELTCRDSKIDLEAADRPLLKTPRAKMFEKQKYVVCLEETEFIKDIEDGNYPLHTEQRDGDELNGFGMSRKCIDVELYEDEETQSRDFKFEIDLELDDLQRFKDIKIWQIHHGPRDVMDLNNVSSVEEGDVSTENSLVAQASHFPDEGESRRLWKVVGCLEQLVLTVDKHILSLGQRPEEGARVGPQPGLVEPSGGADDLGELIVEEKEKCSEIKSYLENLSKMMTSSLKALQQNAESTPNGKGPSTGLPLPQLGTELVEHYTQSIAKLLESYLQAQAALMTASQSSVAQRLECECLQRSCDQALGRLQQIKVEVNEIENEIETTTERGGDIRDRLDAAQAEAQRMSGEIQEISGDLKESAKECEALETDLQAVTQISSDGALRGPGWDRPLLEKRINLLNDMLSSHQKKIRDLVAQMDGMREKLGEEKMTNHQLTTEISQLKYEIHEMKFLVEFLESERELEKSKLAAGPDCRDGASEDVTSVMPPYPQVPITPPPSAVDHLPSPPGVSFMGEVIGELGIELDVSVGSEQALAVDDDVFSSNKSVQTDHAEPVLVICKEELDWEISPLDFLFDHCERESDLLMERIQRLDSFVRTHMASSR